MDDSVTFSPIAVVGVGGVLPGAADLDGLWANLAAGVDAAGDVPAGRWLLDPAECFQRGGPAPDKVYCTRGYFLDSIPLDLDGLDVDPDLVARLDPVFHLALAIGRMAWKDAVTDALDRRRVGVILGNIALPTAAVSQWSRDLIGRGASDVHPLNRHVTGLPAGLLA